MGSEDICGLGPAADPGGAGASWIPLRRAAGVDPIQALRHE